MPAHAALIGMALVALGMVLIPGPNMMYLVSRSVSQGYRAGLFSLIGTGTGFVIYMVMANVGMAEVFLIVPWLYIGLKLCGARVSALPVVENAPARRSGAVRGANAAA